MVNFQLPVLFLNFSNRNSYIYHMIICSSSTSSSKETLTLHNCGTKSRELRKILLSSTKLNIFNDIFGCNMYLVLVV